ncbi:DUF4291 domain-containing protein [Janthinobacterium sp. FT14W]|uniref:DUF4291 domain-containing protein n=1 Tax=Janthinobacterium sp. FT14W TaxID=2654253 RepID=UPI001D003D2B|nr:DUF4291 domain-containing protein [Janthinobacterium sp. FT14W]
MPQANEAIGTVFQSKTEGFNRDRPGCDQDSGGFINAIFKCAGFSPSINGTKMQDHNHATSVTPQRQIRASYDKATIRVYQAFSDVIADAALEKGTFTSPPFKMERMTWIKPSFLWMMYRAGWGFKDAGQKRILAIDISRAGFEWALEHGCLSHADESMSKEEWTAKKETSPVRIQWDPERDLLLRPQPYRAIQIGLGNEAVEMYVHKWIVRIVDVTPLAHSIHALLTQEKFEEAMRMLPEERVYLSAFHSS